MLGRVLFLACREGGPRAKMLPGSSRIPGVRVGWSELPLACLLVVAQPSARACVKWRRCRNVAGWNCVEPPLMLMKRVRRGCPFKRRGTCTRPPPKEHLTIPIMLRSRRDRTRRPCKQIVIWQFCTSGGRGTSSYFKCLLLAHDGLFLLGGDSTCRSRQIPLCCRTRPHSLQ